MKKRICFVLLVLTLFAFSESIYAQTPQSQFGYVNVSDAVLLHPTMRHFDIKTKRFRLEALKGVNKTQRIEENKKESKANLDNITMRIKELEKSRKELEEEYQAKTKKIILSQEKIKNMSENEKNKYNEKKNLLETEYLIEANNIRKKIYAANKEFENYVSKPIDPGLTSPKETEQIFSLILDDVYDAMEAIAAHYKVAFVFNSSAEIAYIESGITIDNPMGNFLDNFDQIVSSKDGKKTTGESLNAWLGQKNSAFRNGNDRRLSAFVMKGGLNMTPAVVDYIYQKHKIGEDQRKFILEFFEKIVNNEEN
ncbi:MAG: OmpH family outer membrane protein [Candidatus Riflebacteria bacterium]|nr:OmpH family outer membrane protein [Candidatus Riflebacteria bacterium]